MLISHRLDISQEKHHQILNDIVYRRIEKGDSISVIIADLRKCPSRWPQTINTIIQDIKTKYGNI